MRNRLARAWRGARYLLVALPTAMVSTLMPFLVLASTLSIAVGGIGLVLLPRMLMAVRKWSNLHRRMAGRLLGEPIETRELVLPDRVGPRLRQVLTDRTIRRDLMWLPVNMVMGIGLGAAALLLVAGPPGTVLETILWWAFPAEAEFDAFGVPLDNWGVALGFALPVSVALAVLAVFALPPMARAHARTTSRLLSSSRADQLEARVEELAETRAGAVSAHGAELRRIERDLHDGTQARLVSIAMRLGMAERALARNDLVNNETIAKLVTDARSGAEEAMTELRDVIRTMYPPILADRGLAGALAALGARCPVPAAVDVGELGDVPAPVEAAAYFVVAETLTNVAKHSKATGVTVRVSRAAARLEIVVTDDGVGGVDENRGTGIIGMRRRVAALDGRFQSRSPLGGPTVVTVELPCES